MNKNLLLGLTLVVGPIFSIVSVLDNSPLLNSVSAQEPVLSEDAAGGLRIQDLMITLDDLRDRGAYQGQTLSTTIRNGVQITKGSNSQDGNFKIKIDADGAISVQMTREYGVDDADKIMESHPELYMYLKAIPTEVGNSKIKIKFEITTTYKADDEAALKEKDADAFALYEKYGKQRRNGFRLPAIRDGRGLRTFRRAPPRIEFRGAEGIDDSPDDKRKELDDADDNDDAPSISVRGDADGNVKAGTENESDKSKKKEPKEPKKDGR